MLFHCSDACAADMVRLDLNYTYKKKKIKYPNTLLLKTHRDLLLMRKCGFVCVCSFLAISHQSKWQLVFLLFSLLIKLAILDFG